MDNEVAIGPVRRRNKDRLPIHAVELDIGLVERCEVRARLELFEGEGALHLDLDGDRVFRLRIK